MKPYGIDISKYQGVGLDYVKMRSATRFVALRAGISWGYEDPTFGPNWRGLAGHNRIAYHVVYPGQDPIRQAAWFLEIVGSYGTDWKMDRLALDLELYQGQSRERITWVVETMMEFLKGKTGRYPILYSRATWVNQFMRMTPKLANADWWLAHYLSPLDYPAYTPEHPGPPWLPSGVDHYLIHQVGEKGNGSAVGVKSYYVDQNRWNGTEQDMQAYFGRFELGFPIIVNPGDGSGEEPEPPEVPDLPAVLYEARVNTVPPNRLRVRSRPSLVGGFVRWLQSGDVVPVFEERAGWSKISGLSAEWAKTSYLSKIVDTDLAFWSQRDSRWANEMMGASGIRFGDQGCLMTATAWVLWRLGVDTDPRRYNLLASTRGGYAWPNLMYWLFPEVLWGSRGVIGQMGIQRAEFQYFNGTGYGSSVDRILGDGRDVLAKVDMVPGGAFNQHWVAIYDKLGNDYVFMDPWNGDSALLSKRYFNIYQIASYRRI